MNLKLVKIGEAARILGCSHDTLRRWDRKGELKPTWRSDGGTRYYSIQMLRQFAERGKGDSKSTTPP